MRDNPPWEALRSGLGSKPNTDPLLFHRTREIQMGKFLAGAVIGATVLLVVGGVFMFIAVND